MPTNSPNSKARQIAQRGIRNAEEDNVAAEGLKSFLDGYFANACGDDLAIRQQVDEACSEYLTRSSHRTSGKADTPQLPARPALATAADHFRDLTLNGLECRRGGMGEVYRITDTNLNRSLALKTIRWDRNTPTGRARFAREIDILTSLDHPGVVPIHSKGILADSRPYYTMRWIGTETTLATLLGERQSQEHGAPDWIRIFLTICEIVARAHQRDVVHRDLKPANIMIGADGEVLILDWGLAKRVGDEESPQDGEAVQEASAGEQLTVAGVGVGSPPYWSPEQARGEIEGLDQRCDVFSLGAILCQVLTGEPPFRLSEAFARLDGCGADAELTKLAKRCLAPAKQDRPRHAGKVAEAVEQYQRALQLRLAKAQAQAAEERRRRRLSLAVAALALLLVLAGGGTGWWYMHVETEKSLRKEKVEENLGRMFAETEQLQKDLHWQLTDPLKVHVLLSDVEGWKNSLKRREVLLSDAKQLVDSNQELRAADAAEQWQVLHEALQKDWRDWRLAQELDDIRLGLFSSIRPSVDANRTGPKYQKFFHDRFGLNVQPGDATRLAAVIEKEATLKYVLVAALDHWAEVSQLRVSQQERLTRGLLEAARRLDPDPWRDQFRQLNVWGDPVKLKRLATNIDFAGQSPQMLALLAHRLKDAGSDYAALLRSALVHHPRDLWLLVSMGFYARTPEEQTGYYQAALAIRPHSSVCYFQLGGALHRLKDLKGAERAVRTAIRLNPNSALKYAALGLVLYDQQNLKGAEEACRKAIQLDSKEAGGYGALGFVLRAQQDLKGAEQAWRKAVDLDPKDAPAYSVLGLILHEQQDLKGGERAFRKSLQIDSKDAKTHYGLGLCLHEQQNLKGAEQALRKAVQLDPKDATACTRLGLVLRDQKNLTGAEQAFRTAIQLDAKEAKAHGGLGLVLYEQEDLRGAEQAFRAALQSDLKDAQAYSAFGSVLHLLKDLKGAEQVYRKAIQIDAKDARAYSGLGLVLYDRNDLKRAEQAFHKSISLDRKCAQAHGGLGLVLRDRKDLKGAEQALRTAVQLDPRDAWAYGRLGLVLRDQKDLTGAEQALRKAVQLDPKDAWAYGKLGTVLGRRKDLKGAEQAYRTAVQLDPKDAWAYRSLGSVLHRRKDLKGAEDAYRKAAENNPKDALVWAGLGFVLREQMDLKGAEQAFRKAIQLDPNVASVHEGLGLVLHEQQDLKGAEQSFRKAIQLDSRSAVSHYLLGLTLRDQGNFAEALKYLEKGNQLGSSLSATGGQWVRECQDLLQMDQRVVTLLQGQTTVANVAEQLALARFSRQYRRYRAAARFYADAFGAQPTLALAPAEPHRFHAACAAALAAAGQGRDANPLTESERAELRRQALTWLGADLDLFAKTVLEYLNDSPARAQKATSPLEKLTGQPQELGPADVLRVCDRLVLWQTTPDLAGFREEKELAKLPPQDQQAWRQLWIRAGQVYKRAESCFTEQRLSGTLTAEQKVQVHELKMAAGRTYAFDLKSQHFKSRMRLEDDQEHKLAEGRKIAPDNQTARIVFTAKQEATVRIVVSPAGQTGLGAYSLTIRAFSTRAR